MLLFVFNSLTCLLKNPPDPFLKALPFFLHISKVSVDQELFYFIWLKNMFPVCIIVLQAVHSILCLHTVYQAWGHVFCKIQVSLQGISLTGCSDCLPDYNWWLGQVIYWWSLGTSCQVLYPKPLPRLIFTVLLCLNFFFQFLKPMNAVITYHDKKIYFYSIITNEAFLYFHM